MTTALRCECPQDVDAIRRVHLTAFPSKVESELVDRLRSAGHLTVSVVALVNNTVVGHVAFSPVSVGTGTTGAGLGPIAVLKDHQGAGIGSQLVQTGLRECQSAGAEWVVVLGDPGFYARFGFRRASDFGLADEYGGGIAFQAIEFEPGALPCGAGLVRYGQEFESVARASL